MMHRLLFCGLVCSLLFALADIRPSNAEDLDSTFDTDSPGTVDPSIGSTTGTDAETVQKEAEAIKLDGLSAQEMKTMREQASKHVFEAEVNRMMKLIINSLYKNKEIFLRELISNASDALDKIRFLSVSDASVLSATDEMVIRIKPDKENNALHITDTGIGMTQKDLVKNLGTIAKSGTSDFLETMAGAKSQTDMSDLIGQFGVGFYSTFLVADKVIVTSKNNDDEQYIWESDSNSFSVVKDPRGDTLKRGTTISLYLKEEARDYLEPNTLKDLVKKYSQFINFNIFLWTSKTESVEEPIEEEPKAEESTDEDAEVKESTDEEDKPKTKTVQKTTWDWELINDTKPIWLRKASEITDEEYENFYRSISRESESPLGKTHFTAEGEVTFKAILYIARKSKQDMFSNYGKMAEHVKLYVRRVFITDDFQDMLPKYLSFVTGVVDSDDLPLNVSRETLQQHKLLKVIKKKLVRKTLDMIKKISTAGDDDWDAFWKEYSTNLKLGVIEDHSNRTRLSKLLRFYSSNDAKKQTTLEQYVERMKDNQNDIYFVGGSSLAEAKKSPFVEQLKRRGLEVLYLTEPIDEYCVQSLPDFNGKKFQNAAKEGIKLDMTEDEKEAKEAEEKEYEPLLKWLQETALKDKIEKALLSDRLAESPAALVATSFGWSGNMERIMTAQAYQKSEDPSQNFYLNQKKSLEINYRHPVIKEMKSLYDADAESQQAKDIANVLFDMATIRSGYIIKDTAAYGEHMDRLLRSSLNIDVDAKIEGLEDYVEPDASKDESPEDDTAGEPNVIEDDDSVPEGHEDL